MTVAYDYTRQQKYNFDILVKQVHVLADEYEQLKKQKKKEAMEKAQQALQQLQDLSE